MSIKLMSAAWDLDIPSTEKMVLLALADSAGHDGICWPAMKSIARKCSKDVRSVRRTMAKLVEDGHISRVVRPGESNLWHVHPAGDKADGYHRYIYRIEAEDGSFYLGRRRSPCSPDDDEYMGSGTWVQNRLASGASLKKSILSTHTSDEELCEVEARIIAAHIDDPLCMNRRNEGAGKNVRRAKTSGGAGKNVRRDRTNLPSKPSLNRKEPSEVKSSASDDRLTPQEILEGWNELAEQCGLPKAGKMTGGRLRQAKARLREYPDLAAWKRAFRHIHDTPFLRGENDRGWRANLDFLLQASSFTKLTEGTYGQAH